MRTKLNVFCYNIEHTIEELIKYDKLPDQFKFRKEIVLQILENCDFDVSTLRAVVGRGGLLPPVKSGWLSGESGDER